MTRSKQIACLAGMTLLAACGSSGSGGGTVDPVAQASTGFAVAGQNDKAGVTFARRGVASYFETGDYSELIAAGPLANEELDYTVDSFQAATSDISVAISDDESEVIFTIDGTTYRLGRFVDPDDPDAIVYLFSDDTQYAGIEFRALSDFVDIFIAEITTNDQSTTIADVIGFDTDPSIIGATTGSATYVGEMTISGERLGTRAPNSGDEGGFDGIDGDLTLTADFDSNRISGNAILTNDPFEDEPLLTETLTFENAAIEGNGFTGKVSSDDSFFMSGQRFDDVTYNGNFYGPDGETVAGSITGEMQIEGEDPLLLLGIFGADN